MLIGADISTALAWDTLPAGTADLLLVFEDLDVPGAVPGIHTDAAFAPPVDLTSVPGTEHLPAAVAGHVLAAGTLTGTRTT
jgi:hypothetical protein